VGTGDAERLAGGRRGWRASGRGAPGIRWTAYCGHDFLSFNWGMRKKGEVVFLPCQFCQRMERREASSAFRAATCFMCKTVRRRQVSREQQRLKRALSNPHMP
jgi:hypothetical protein